MALGVENKSPERVTGPNEWKSAESLYGQASSAIVWS